jgi:superfamily II DNA or RNA helicase
MSVKILFSSLNSDEKSKLESNLIFTPKQKNYKGRNKKKFIPSQAGGFLGFNIQNDIIQLPFAYGKKHYSSLIIPNTQQVSCHISFKGTLYDYQSEIVEKAKDSLRRTGSTILAIYTGGGKTVIASYLACCDPGLTLVLCESTTLLTQWDKTFKENTDAKVWIVGEDIPQQANVIICMDTRFEKLPVEYRILIKTLIIDEAHCFPTPTRYPCFLGLEPKYVIAATATPHRDDGLFQAIEAVCGTDKILKISTKPFNAMKYETGIDVPIILNKQGTPDWAKLVKALCENPDRNKLILDTVVMNLNQGSKILILTWREDHTRYLEKQLASMSVSVDRMSGNKRNYNDSRVLVGTISKIGKGFDEKSACADFNGIRLDLLLLVGSMRSIELLEQVAGRVFRAQFPSIIHFCDNNKISKSHWTDAAVWYRSRNGRICISQSPLVNKQKSLTPTVLAEQQLARYHNKLQNQ